MPTNRTTDVAVIGGGPAGLTAALVLGRQKRSVTLIDSGRPRNAPAAEMHMYLGSDGRAPSELRERGSLEVTAHPNVEVVHTTVTGIDTSEQTAPVRIRTGDGGEVHADRILLATGVRDDVSTLPGVSELFGRGVFHCPFCHGHETTGRRLAVLTDNPVDPAQPGMQAIYLATHFSPDVTLLTHCHEVPDRVRELLEHHGVHIDEREVTSVSGTDGDLTVTLGSDDVGFGAVFHSPREASLLDGLGADLETEGAHVLVDWQQRTSDPRVFAAGDCARRRDDPIPLAFVSQSVATGQAAGLWIDQDLFLTQTGIA